MQTLSKLPTITSLAELEFDPKSVWFQGLHDHCGVSRMKIERGTSNANIITYNQTGCREE